MLRCIILVLAAANANAEWKTQAIDSKADFRGLAVVDDKTAWVSGTQGTVASTVDGGQTWSVVSPPNTEMLDFRDIEAFDANIAYVLSIGPGEASRIYKTIDGGKTWDKQFQNDDNKAFYDAIAFWDRDRGIALSDPVNGKYRILKTTDGGRNWKVMPDGKMPAALEKEGAFAASGTCLITKGKKEAYFVTGGAKKARVFHSTDGGESWDVTNTDIDAGSESVGGFSIAFKNEKEGVIVGGDYRKPEESEATLAFTSNGGRQWITALRMLPFRSCVVWHQDRWIAAGTTGVDESTGAVGWKRTDDANYNVVRGGWAAGPKGRIAKRTP